MNYKEAPVNYNNFLYDCAVYRETGNLDISPDTIKNTKQYNELFGPETLKDIWFYNLKNS